jgi:penicillin-binding protein 1A
MVRIDRRSGNRVFDGWPADDPQAAVIWEAFKPDTEPRRTRRQGQADQLRELVLAQLRRGNGAGTSARSAATPRASSRPTSSRKAAGSIDARVDRACDNWQYGLCPNQRA